MATDVVPSASLTRYRPVILSMVGFAAIYGAYLVYSTTTQNAPQSRGIHRSNAVHRSRRARRSQTPAPESGTDGRQFNIADISDRRSWGRWEFANGEGVLIGVNLHPDDMPSLEQLQQEHGLRGNEAASTLREMRQNFITRFLLAQFNSLDRIRELSDRWVPIMEWLIERGMPQDQIQQGLDDLRTHMQGEIANIGDRIMSRARQGMFSGDAESVALTDTGLAGRRSGGPGLNLKQLLYHIAENQARQEGFVHRGFRCDHCSTSPIRGTRWKCSNCTDIDLCNDCHSTAIHNHHHIFYEIRIPTYTMGPHHVVQEVSYPGCYDLRFNPSVQNLDPTICKALVEQTEFEKAEVEGLYEQFKCLVTVARADDCLGAVVDRTAFQQSVMSLSKANALRQNLIFDRLYALFDTNGDGFIDFREFVKGVAFVRDRTRSKARRKRIFAAYDLDGDGYVTRQDFLRMFRALFELQRTVNADILSPNQIVNGLRSAKQMATSSQVISAASPFNHESIPGPRNRTLPVKPTNPYGDRRDQPSQGVVNSSGLDEIEREEIFGNSWESQAQFPFDDRTGEPMSIRDFLYLAPRDSRGQPPTNVARDHLVRFGFDGKPLKDARRQAWHEHLQRREELASHRAALNEKPTMLVNDGGIDTPASTDADGDDYDEEEPLDLNIGGYDITIPDIDFGLDLMYQVVDEGLRELIDPIFKPREDVAIELGRAKLELLRWADEIDAYREKKAKEKEHAEKEARDPLLATAAGVATEMAADETSGQKAATNQPASPAVQDRGNDTANEMEQTVSRIEHEVVTQPLSELLRGQGFGVREAEAAAARDPNSTQVAISTSATPTAAESNASNSLPPAIQGQTITGSLLVSTTTAAPLTPDQPAEDVDPTMPQFKPNSEADIRDDSPRDITLDPMRPPAEPKSEANGDPRPKFEAEIIRQFEEMFLGWDRDNEGIVVNSTTDKARSANETANEEKPDESRLARLMELQDLEATLKEKKITADMVSFEDLEEFIAKNNPNSLHFLENFLEVCYF